MTHSRCRLAAERPASFEAFASGAMPVARGEFLKGSLGNPQAPAQPDCFEFSPVDEVVGLRLADVEALGSDRHTMQELLCGLWWLHAFILNLTSQKVKVIIYT